MAGTVRYGQLFTFGLAVSLVATCAAPPGSPPSSQSNTEDPGSSATPRPSPMSSASPSGDMPPAQLLGKYWWTPLGQIGTIGGGLLVSIGSTEVVLAVGGGFAITYDSDATPTAAGIELIVWSLADGSVADRIDSAVLNPRVLIVGDHVYWAGMSPTSAPGNGAPQVDGGVWSAALPSGDVVAIVEPGVDVTGLNAPARGPLHASESGQTLTSAIVGRDGSRTDVVDTRTDSVRGALDDVIVVALNDSLGTAIVAGSGLIGVDLDSGDLSWRHPVPGEVDSVQVESVAAFGSRVFGAFGLIHEGASRGDIVSIELASGNVSTLLSRSRDDEPPLFLHSSLSTLEWLVLSSEIDIGTSIADGTASMSLIDTSTGELTLNAFRIERE